MGFRFLLAGLLLSFFGILSLNRSNFSALYNPCTATTAKSFVLHAAGDDDDDRAKQGTTAVAAADTTTPSPMTTTTMGVVLVDVRPTGEVPTSLIKVIGQLGRVTKVPVEVWVSQATAKESQVLQQLVSTAASKNPPQHVIIRTMKDSHTAGNHTETLQGVAGGHVGKAYALKESSFDIPVVIDGDVWPCNDGFLRSVEEKIRDGSSDVLWTLAPMPFGASKFENDKYVDPRIAQQIDEYKTFPERNSGTIFAVRRTNSEVQSWLDLAMDVWVHQTNTPNFLMKDYTDQAAFRESFFLHRDKLTESLDTETCRMIPKHTCDCACDCTPCTVIHNKGPFQKCAAAFTL